MAVTAKGKIVGKAKSKPESVPAKTPGSTRNVGKTQGLKIFEYQNQSLEQNEKNKLTDEQLAKDWRAEYPRAMSFDAGMVRNVRNLYNKGKHKNDLPAKPFHGYDADGTPIRNRGEAKAEAPKKAKPVAAAAAPKIVKKFKKTA